MLNYRNSLRRPSMINLCLGSAPDNHQNCQPNLRQKSTLDAKMTESRMYTRYRPRFFDHIEDETI